MTTKPRCHKPAAVEPTPKVHAFDSKRGAFLDVHLTPQMWAAIDRLFSHGIFGKTEAEVVEELISSALRNLRPWWER